MDAIPGDLGLYVEQFHRQSEQNLGWMKAFNDRVTQLSKLYRDTCRDLERERIAGRVAQEQAEIINEKLHVLEESAARSAFVLVLIDADADAYLFDDKYYRDDAADGGERAAVDLRAAVRQHLKSIDDGTLAGLPIVVKAFASGDGLAYILSKAGIIRQGDAQDVVSRFTRGFSQADDMFDFVLVGKGKDRADHKLMAAFRQFAENPSCRRILLAGCHDNGYVRMLEKYVRNVPVAEKVTLLKSFQTGSEYAALPFASTSMSSVFRTRRLSMPPGAINNLAVQYPPSLTQASPKRETLLAPCSPPASPTTAPLALATTKPTPPPTYATRAASSPPPPGLPRPVPLSTSLADNVILVNAADHRIDATLPPKSAGAVERIHHKTTVAGKRYCNPFHLSGSCGGGCSYSHEPLSAAEKLVLRHRLRGEKCHERGRCRDPRCYYGHHCGCGAAKKCNFSVGMHGVDVGSWREVCV
ncbi:hypothetical protein QBC39DRAFT_399304 [Podospora conica]|nr:hypothetical protein QBC39DRAFT_399304 [Schizothecium conicum]